MFIKNKTLKNFKIIRILGRIFGIIAALASLYFIIFTGMAPENQGNEQIISINVMLAFLIFGFIIGWFREREGGLILTFGSLIMYLYVHYLPPGLFMYSWLFALLYLLSGGLLIYQDHLNRKNAP